MTWRTCSLEDATRRSTRPGSTARLPSSRVNEARSAGKSKVTRLARPGCTIPAVQHMPGGPWAGITLLSFGGLPGAAEIRDNDGVTMVTARHQGNTFIVESSGPARIAGVEFAAVAGRNAQPKIIEEHRT